MVRKAALLVTLVTSVAAAGVVALPASSAVAASPPPVENFGSSALSVIAGSSVSLHWGTATGQSYLLTSNGPNPLPNFGSNTVVSWPANPGGTWNGTYQWWASTANAVSVTIPSLASPGTTYALQLYTCFQGLCSNASGGGGYSQVTITVASKWSTAPYWTAFPNVTKTTDWNGDALDVAFTGSTIWNSSEFSDAVGESLSGQPNLTSIVDPADVANTPFAQCVSSPCGPSAISALGERVVYADNLVWFTQGGWELYPGGPPANHSEVVAYNPWTQGFCTYLVPGDNGEVMGLAATGSGAGTVIWFVDSDPIGHHPALDSFSPSKVGANCPNNYSLAGAGGFRQITWPQADRPALVSADPDGTDLWVTDFWGSEVDKVTIATGAIKPYTYPSGNAYSFLGLAQPWQVVADGGYVYAIDYGDSDLVRINKATGVVDKVPIPVTSDAERGYGLALSAGTLYFTLSDDPQPAFGADSALGYVNVAAWEAASAGCWPGWDCAPAPTTAVVYSGLSAAADPISDADFRGIASGNNGQLAIADLHQVLRLSP